MLTLQFVISDDVEIRSFDVVINIIPAVIDNPPQFETQLSLFNISENARDGALVGRVMVMDDMGKHHVLA